MEGEREPEGTYTQRGEPLTLIEEQAAGLCCGDDDTAPPEISVTEEGDINQLEGPSHSGSVGGDTSPAGKDGSPGDAEAPSPSSEAPDAVRDSRGDEAGRILLSDGPPLALTHLTQPSPPLSSHFRGIQDRVSEPCWYCLRSLEPEHRPQEPEQQTDVMALQQDHTSVAAGPPGGQRVNYQTDPRPHFGVAYSSRSTALPLWGSEGPSWVLRNPDLADQTHTCPHCLIALPPDTLRWHEAKCLIFDGV